MKLTSKHFNFDITLRQSSWCNQKWRGFNRTTQGSAYIVYFKFHNSMERVIDDGPLIAE